MATSLFRASSAVGCAARLLPLLLSVAVCAQETAAVPETTLAPNQATTVAMDTIWETRPHWSQEGYGTLLAATRQADGYRIFEVHARGQSAVWWRPLDQPISLASFPLARLRLRATGLSPESQGFLVSLLLSDPKGGVARMRGILSPDELLDAKSWETRTVDLRNLGEFETVLGIKVEFWAATQGPSPAALALQPIVFLADGTPPSDPASATELAFVVRDRAGSPIPDCRVAIDHENLNARVSGTTDNAGQVVLRSRIATANHTAALAAPGFLLLELAGLDTATPNEVSLIPAMAVQGTLRCEGQPVPGIVRFDTKVPRPVIGRFPRALSVAAGADGRWQAAVPAQAYAWLVQAGTRQGGTANAELTDAAMVPRWCGLVDVPRESDLKAWQAQTPDWTLREGDNDAVASIAADPAEPVNRRARAMAGLAALVAAEPDAATYYQLDLAWIGARADSSLFADQAVQALLAVLRRAGTRPDQAAARLRELSGGTLPMPLRQRLDGQTGSWEEAIAQVESDRGAMLAQGKTLSRTANGKSAVDLVSPWSLRQMEAAEPASMSQAVSRPVSSASGGIDLANPRHQGTIALRPPPVAAREGAVPLPEATPATGPATDGAVALATVSGRDCRAITAAVPRQIAAGSAALSPLDRETLGVAELVSSFQDTPGAVSVQAGAPDTPSASGFVLGPAPEARDTAAETALVRQQSVVIAGLVQQGKAAEARTETLGLLGRVTTRSAIFDCLPLLALTGSRDGNADRKAVLDCLDTLANATPRTQANAYVAGMLHCYRCDDTEFAQEIQARYRRQFPDAKPDPAVLLASSLCLVRQGQREEAHTLLATIVRDFPAANEAPRAALLLGWIELSRQKYPEARALFEDLVRTYPRNPCAAKAKSILRQLPQVAP